MLYIEKRPSEALQKYIKCIWTMEYEGLLPPSENERILPDGYTEIIINFSDKFKIAISGKNQQLLSNNFVSGPFSKYLHLSATGKVGLLGIRFWPGMMHTFFNLSMKELTNNYFDLNLIQKELSKELEFQVLSSKDFTERFTKVNGILFKYMVKNLTPPQQVVEAAIKAISESHGLIAIEDLCRHIGISTRQLQRLFDEKVGLTPKTFNRIIRFQSIFKELELNPTSNWLALALQCGYYDQAHFIKEFKEFSGMNPTSYFTGSNELTKYFTTKIRMSDLYNTLK